MLQPHRSRYWEHPNIEDWDEFAEQVEQICQVHATAQVQSETRGLHTISTDEKPGIQAASAGWKNLASASRASRTSRIQLRQTRHTTRDRQSRSGDRPTPHAND